jgi:hypothetical protein
MSAAADDDEFSLASDDSYVTNLTASLHLGDLEDMADHEGGVFNFDLDFVFNEDAPPNQYSDHGSVKTFRDICAQTTRKEKATAQAIPSTDPSRSHGKPSTVDPLAGSNIDTGDATQATQASTLTDPAGSGVALQQMMTNNLDLVHQFFTNHPQLFNALTISSTSTVSPSNSQGADGRY